MRVVLVGRVSRGERQQDPESQLAPLRAAAERHGWVVVKEVSLKLSAWDDVKARQVREAVLAPIRAGEADGVAVWCFDRVVRGGIDVAFSFLRELEEHHGAVFFSLQEPFLSTATADRQTREIMLSLVAWVAKWESERKSERLKAKAAEKRRRAAAIGQRAKWGMGSLASLEDRARVMALRASGGTVRGIAGDTGLSKSQVQRIIKEESSDNET